MESSLVSTANSSTPLKAGGKLEGFEASPLWVSLIEQSPSHFLSCCVSQWNRIIHRHCLVLWSAELHCAGLCQAKAHELQGGQLSRSHTAQLRDTGPLDLKRKGPKSLG